MANPIESSYVGEYVTVTGWGRTSDGIIIQGFYVATIPILCIFVDLFKVLLAVARFSAK